MTHTRIEASTDQASIVSGSTSVCGELTAVAGIAVSLVALVLVFVVPGPGAALAGALLIACFPAGAAVMCWVDSGERVLQAGLTLVLSLAITGIAGAAMIWLHTWHPYLLLLFAPVCIVSNFMRLRSYPLQIRWERHPIKRGLPFQLMLLSVGLVSWAYGVGQVRPETVGAYGLLASTNIWFLFGFATLVIGALFELCRPEPRAWLLGVYLTSVLIVIFATVPILYGVPEYAWVYKHIGIAQALGKYGQITAPNNIYEQWPALFAAIAGVSGVSHFSPISFAAWAPLAFELADALLLLGIFRLLGATSRMAWVALFMYEGVIAWIGQDYLSPQAFGYLLWLGIVAIIIRWLPAVPPGHARKSKAALARGPFLVDLPSPSTSSQGNSVTAIVLIVIIYFAIVAAHQLTPYLALAGVAALALLGLLRRGWLLLFLMVVIAGTYLGFHYNLISQQFGGLFSGGNVLSNARGIKSAFHDRARIVDMIRTYTAISYSIWPATLGAIALQWRSLGRVITPALLAFSPFTIIAVQSYGGEAIYRVLLFSAPWCSLLIAGMLAKLRPVIWRMAVTCTFFVALTAGLFGAYEQVSLEAFNKSELAASLWLYDHAPKGSVFVLPVDNFPDLEVADFHSFVINVIPAVPSSRPPNINEANVAAVQRWIISLGRQNVYVVFSRSEAAMVDFYGAPYGYNHLVNAVKDRPGWLLVYRNAYATIYKVRLLSRGSG